MGYNRIMNLHKRKIVGNPEEDGYITTVCGGPSFWKVAVVDEDVTCGNCLRNMAKTKNDRNQIGRDPSPGRNPDSDKG